MSENVSWVLSRIGIVMVFVGLFAGIIAAFFVFFWFMSRRNEKKVSGFWKWMYDFLHFKNFAVSGCMKFFYTLGACVCTGIGIFCILSLQLLNGLLVLFLGNLCIRVIYEFVFLFLGMCKNINQINIKMGETSEEDNFGEFQMPPRFRSNHLNEVCDMTAMSEYEFELDELDCCNVCGRIKGLGDTYCSQCGIKL